MSTYSVTLYIALDKSFEVEADSEDEAVTKAERLMAKETVGEGFTVDDVAVECDDEDADGDEEESDE